MAASRSLYRDIAESFRILLASTWPRTASREAIAATARAVAIDLKRDNRNFSFPTFYEACSLDENGFPRDADV